MSTQIPSNENLYQNYTPVRYKRGEVATMSIKQITKMVQAKRKKQPDQLPLDDREIATRVRAAARGISVGPEVLTTDQALLGQLVELQWTMLETQNQQTRQLRSIGTVMNLIGVLIVLGLIAAFIQTCLGPIM